MTVIRCTATVLSARGQRPCLDRALWIATDPNTGDQYYRCQEHSQRMKAYGYALEKLSEPRKAVPGDLGFNPRECLLGSKMGEKYPSCREYPDCICGGPDGESPEHP